MEKYRKSDQYYIDQYDRFTIDMLKEKEMLFKKAQQDLYGDDDNDEIDDEIDGEIDDETEVEIDDETKESLKNMLSLSLRFSESGIQAARNKSSTIQQWKERDERKDRLIEKHLIPSAPYCNICKDDMRFFDYDFINDDFDLQFIFSCGNGTKHNQILSSNGQPYKAKVRCCPYCNGEIDTIVKKTKYKITSKERCTKCTWSNVTVFDLPKPVVKKVHPINEDDRKKYCTAFVGRRDFIEDLKLIASSKFDEDKDDGYDLKNVEKINLPKVEERLTKAIEQKGFIKFLLEQPKISGNVTVKFSVQDPTERTPEKSTKILKKTIADELFPTNWRLMNTIINYRLGYLDGQIKGVDLKEDLIKIAKEIQDKKS